MAIIVIPPSLAVFFYGAELLELWTANHEIAKNVAPILTVLILGTLCNALVNVPYILQISYGWTNLAIKVNLVATLILIPSILLFVPKYGVKSAAWIWFVLNLGYLLISSNLMFRRLLKKEKISWWRNSIFLPLVAGGLMSFFFKTISKNIETNIGLIVFIAASTFMVYFSTCIATPLGRRYLFKLYTHFRGSA
jgi:O-antigen/teichoic acid export membrane protein